MQIKDHEPRANPNLTIFISGVLGPSSIKVLPSRPYIDTARNPRLPLANSSNSRSCPKIVGFSDVKVLGGRSGRRQTSLNLGK